MPTWRTWLTHCARIFNALTGTPLARLRHRSKWLPYLDCMLQSGTVRRTAALAGIHKNTSFAGAIAS